MGFSETQIERYSRQILVREIGANGQLRLLASHVIVGGLFSGGLPAAEHLAAAGIGQLTLVAQSVEERRAAEDVSSINPDCHVEILDLAALSTVPDRSERLAIYAAHLDQLPAWQKWFGGFTRVLWLVTGPEDVYPSLACAGAALALSAMREILGLPRSAEPVPFELANLGART